MFYCLYLNEIIDSEYYLVKPVVDSLLGSATDSDDARDVVLDGRSLGLGVGAQKEVSVSTSETKRVDGNIASVPGPVLVDNLSNPMYEVK